MINLQFYHKRNLNDGRCICTTDMKHHNSLLAISYVNTNIIFNTNETTHTVQGLERGDQKQCGPTHQTGIASGKHNNAFKPSALLQNE